LAMGHASMRTAVNYAVMVAIFFWAITSGMSSAVLGTLATLTILPQVELWNQVVAPSRHGEVDDLRMATLARLSAIPQAGQGCQVCQAQERGQWV